MQLLGMDNDLKLERMTFCKGKHKKHSENTWKQPNIQYFITLTVITVAGSYFFPVSSIIPVGVLRFSKQGSAAISL